MPPVVVDPKEVFEFESSDAFEAWLKKNHDKAPGLWIKVHKKGSGLKTITTAEALDVALCWGWIDAIRKSFDANSFLQRYTPRQKRSPWSLINTQHVARLIEAKRMQAPGHAEIERAKADGRWDIAYTGAKDMKTPPDLMAAIDANKKARAMFDTLTSQNRYALSFRLVNLKTAEARERNVKKFVDMLARGETIYPNRPASVLKKELEESGRPLQRDRPAKKAPKQVSKKSVAKTAKTAAKKVASKVTSKPKKNA